MKVSFPAPMLAVMAALVGLAAPATAQAPPAGPPLTFRAAMNLAMERSPNLAAARLQRNIREAGVQIARQFPNPELAFEATKDTPHYTLNFAVPVEIGGKRGRRIDVAKAELGLADVDVRTAMKDLRRSVRQAFYGLAAADERVKVTEAVLAVAERVRQVAQARFDEGAAPRLEVLEADLGVARAKTDLDVTRSDRIAAQADLNALLNQPAGQVLTVSADLADAPPIPTLDRAITMATASNVELLALDKEMEIEQGRARLLRADRIPTPVFSIGGVFDSPGEFNAGPSTGLTLGLPLFSRNQGEIAQSVATVSQLSAQRDATRRTVESEVFGMIARISARRRQIDIYRTSLVPTATSLEALAEESYRLGRIPVLALLDAQRSLRDVQREYLQLLLDFQMAVADLEEVIGAPIDAQ
jgi:cobalt-zinc-cadmium efflux system outer membrane protein